MEEVRVLTLGGARRRLVASSSEPRQNMEREKHRGANFIMAEIGACDARVCESEGERPRAFVARAQGWNHGNGCRPSTP